MHGDNPLRVATMLLLALFFLPITTTQTVHPGCTAWYLFSHENNWMLCRLSSSFFYLRCPECMMSLYNHHCQTLQSISSLSHHTQNCINTQLISSNRHARCTPGWAKRVQAKHPGIAAKDHGILGGKRGHGRGRRQGQACEGLQSSITINLPGGSCN